MGGSFVIFVFILTTFSSNIFAYDVVCFDNVINFLRDFGLEPGYTPGQNLDPSLCTHYSYWTLSRSINEVTGQIDVPLNKTHLSQIKALKTKNPKLKTMISLYNIWDLNNSRAIKTFVKSTVEFLKNNSLDGAELGLHDNPQGKNQTIFKMTMETLKAAFDLNNLTLSAFVIRETNYDVAVLKNNLDFINLGGFDLNSPFDKRSTLFAVHPSPLKSDNMSELTADWLVKSWINRGFPANKINLGIPTDAYSWSLTSNVATPPAPANGIGLGGDSFALAGISGLFTSRDVCKLVNNASNGYQVFRDPKNYTGPYAVSPATGSPRNWIGYDDHIMATIKANYAIANGLRGAYVYDLSYDDYDNTCGTGFYPITAAISKALNASPGSVPTVSPVTTKKPTTPMSTTKSTTTKSTTTKSTTTKTTTTPKTTTKPKTKSPTTKLPTTKSG